MKRLLAVMAVAMTGCSSSGDPPPSCQQALTHYYGAGCSYFDPTTNPPTPIAQSTMIARCQTATTQTPASCLDEVDAWLTCNDRVPNHATSDADCDCSASYMLLLECH